jgi:hypothetical protein
MALPLKSHLGNLKTETIYSLARQIIARHGLDQGQRLFHSRLFGWQSRAIRQEPLL